MPIKDPELRRENHRRYMKEVWYPKHKQSAEVRARLIVRNKVKTGELLPVAELVCEKCGGTDDVQRHHDDHTKPLDVQVLCITCHRKQDIAGNSTGRGEVSYASNSEFDSHPCYQVCKRHFTDVPGLSMNDDTRKAFCCIVRKHGLKIVL